MRNIIAISLLLLLLFPAIGYFTAFKIQQQKIRKEIKTKIKAGVPKDELVLLKIPKDLENKPNSTFKRIHSKEFRYKGLMYDIVSKKDYAEITWYYCVTDHQETRLFAHLNVLVNEELSTNATHRNQKSKIKQWLYSFYVLKKSNDLQIALKSIEIKTSFQFSCVCWKEIPLTPPPQYLV